MEENEQILRKIEQNDPNINNDMNSDNGWYDCIDLHYIFKHYYYLINYSYLYE